jgi:hypothetical protein
MRSGATTRFGARRRVRPLDFGAGVETFTAGFPQEYLSSCAEAGCGKSARVRVQMVQIVVNHSRPGRDIFRPPERNGRLLP